MVALNITQFSGISPKMPPKYLNTNQAQIALNCATWNGPIQPLYDPEYVVGGVIANIQTIYKFGQEIKTDTEYWFEWNTDVDVVKGFIAGDINERTYYTGDGIPQVTDATLALGPGAANLPRNSYMIGVPTPDIAPTIEITGATDETALPESRSYVYTVVNGWGEESPPSLPSEIVSVYFEQTVDLTLPSIPSGNYDFDQRRIYRSATGSSNSAYLYVGFTTTSTFHDDKLSEVLNEPLPSLEWSTPPEDLTGLVGLAGGVLAGFVGNDVYFSEPFRPFAFPEAYSQVVGSKIVGLGSLDTTLVVLTQGKPVFMQGSHPANMVVVEADVSQSCVSKRSIVSINGAIYYASPDGLVGIAPGGSKVITASIFDKTLWSTFNPSSIKGFTHDGQYHGFYDTGVVQGGFIYDPQSSSFTMHEIHLEAGYSDLETDTFYTVSDNDIGRWGEGAVKTYTWRSKVFLMANHISFSCFRVDAEAYPIEFTLFKDGEVFHTQTITDNQIKRLPAGRGREWDAQVVGSTELFAISIAQSPSELAQDGE